MSTPAKPEFTPSRAPRPSILDISKANIAALMAEASNQAPQAQVVAAAPTASAETTLPTYAAVAAGTAPVPSTPVAAVTVTATASVSTTAASTSVIEPTTSMSVDQLAALVATHASRPSSEPIVSLHQQLSAATPSALVTAAPAATDTMAAVLAARITEIDPTELALMHDPNYAPYYAYFQKYQTAGTTTIGLAELAPLLREVGYCFSQSVVNAVFTQYFPDINTRLKFSDFLRLMQFSLTDLDSTLRAHLTPAVQSAQFQTVDANAVLADMLSLIEYDTPSGQYDFRAAEARLAQLHQHDAQQVAQLQQQQQQQQQVICTVSQPAPVPASIVTATTSTTSTPDAHGLDADDEKFIQSGFALCLAEFDSDKDGAIDARVSLPQSLRAMGLNFSDADLAAHVERIDKLKTGLVDYQDFRQYYALLWRERVARGVDEAHVRAAFHDATSTTGSTGRYRDLGSAEGGALTLDQFKHALRSLAADRLSESEIQQICRAADINHDSVIDVDEFVALLALEQPSSISLRKSILRASHASPTEYLAAFRLQPSTFRLSALCGLATRPQLSLSTLLAPRLNADGVGFFDLALDGGIATQPLKDAVDSGYHDSEDLAQQAARAVAAASSTTQSQMMNVSASTVAPIGTVLALKAAPLVTIVNNLPAHTTDASPLCLALHLQKATGVPIPRDDKARAAIKERLVRVCAFEGNTPVSNVHTCEVAWSPEAEDEWVLDGDSKDGITLQWNQFAFRTKRRVLTVVIELVALVEPDVALAPSKVVDDRATHRGQRLELCCAHTRLEFDRQQWVSVTRETEVELPLSGGASLPITAAIPILKSEILARRDSFFSRVFSPDTPPSVLSVLVRPATKLSSRFELFVQCLPLDVIVTLPVARIIRIYRELLADSCLRLPFTVPVHAPAPGASVMGGTAPMKSGWMQTISTATSSNDAALNVRATHPFSVPLAVFLRLADMPEALHGLSMIWEETRQQIDLSDRRDESDGRARSTVKLAFAKTILSALPVLQAAALSAPLLSFENGNRESKQVSIAARAARVLHVFRLQRPLLALNSDSMTVESALVAMRAQSDQGKSAGSLQALLGGSAAVGLFGKSAEQAHAITGGGAVPVAMNSQYMPFDVSQLMFDPLESQVC